MKERPILFSGPMVRAILEGTKTQTRRVVKFADGEKICSADRWLVATQSRCIYCPYGQPGDRLWVRETFSVDCDPHWILYRADNKALRMSGGQIFDACEAADLNKSPRWKPSIFMFRAMSRITLEVTGVRVERLQDISEADALAEGMEAVGTARAMRGESLQIPPQCQYSDLWDSINAKTAPWASNPWVWVVEFRGVTP